MSTMSELSAVLDAVTEALADETARAKVYVLEEALRGLKVSIRLAELDAVLSNGHATEAQTIWAGREKAALQRKAPYPNSTTA